MFQLEESQRIKIGVAQYETQADPFAGQFGDVGDGIADAALRIHQTQCKRLVAQIDVALAQCSAVVTPM